MIVPPGGNFTSTPLYICPTLKKLRTTTQTLLLLAPFGFYSTAYCSHTFAHRQRAAEHQKPTSITHNPLYEYTVRQGLNGERRVELDLEATPRRT